MYWMGDSTYGWRQNLPKIPKEMLQGLSDNIPLCCTLYYTFVKLLCLVIHGPFKNIKPPTKEDPYGSYGWTPDIWVFYSMYKYISKIIYMKEHNCRALHSEDFIPLQYWRCPICKLLDKKKKLKWKGLRWEL